MSDWTQHNMLSSEVELHASIIQDHANLKPSQQLLILSFKNKQFQYKYSRNKGQRGSTGANGPCICLCEVKLSALT